jgi:hypothetical protein
VDLLGALHSMHHGRKIDQERILNGFDDVPVMLHDGVLDEPVMHLQQPQHAGFVSAHLTAEAHDVREHDRC